MAAGKKTTIVIDADLERRVAEAAAKAGINWASMLKMLAREALQARGVK